LRTEAASSEPGEIASGVPPPGRSPGPRDTARSSYTEAGVDCVYPITPWETDALRSFMSEARGPVNIVRLPQAPSLVELAALGVARVSWGLLLYKGAMARFKDELASLAE
jgi:2-methylisocitrate lyase-like PEP mutase family enzyme